MRAFLLLAVLAMLVLTFSSTSSAQNNYTVCQNYSGQANSTNTTQVALLTAIVGRAALGGNFTSPTTGVNYTIPGLFNPAGPLYAIFSGQQQYRVNAPNYTSNATALGILGGHLVAYFGALFGCTAAGFPAVNNYNMYAVHQNMSINYTMEYYFDVQLALTLLSFGVDPAVVNGPATQILFWFNRCGAPVLSNPSPIQICGTSDCPIATNANYSTCVAYYGYPALMSSSSSSGGSVPYIPPTYGNGSLAVQMTVNFAQQVSAAAGAAAVAMDVAYNIAYDANNTVPNAGYNASVILPYIIVTYFNGSQIAPASRRLLQTNISSVVVRFVILNNFTLIPASTLAGYVVSNINNHNFLTPSLSMLGATVPAQTTSAVTPGSYPVSSSSAATGAYSTGATGNYISSTGNGAVGKYAAGGLFVAAAAIVASLLL